MPNLIPHFILEKYARRELQGAFQAATRPAVLLATVGAKTDRQLGWHLYVAQVDRPPAFEESPVGKIQVFSEGIGFPAAGGIEGFRLYEDNL